MFCREQVAQLRGIAGEVRELGAELVAIGNGSPEQAARFRDDEGLDFTLLVDPKLGSYRAAGLLRGAGKTLGLKSLIHAGRALGKGHLQGPVRGDAWQQGGAFIIDPRGEVLFSYISREAGDHPDPRDLLEVLRS